MQRSTEKIIESKVGQHIIRESDLSFLFKGSSARRYALVNKALKQGELIRICRGFYTLNSKYLQTTPHPYTLANRIVPHSFISAESALSFHNLIPERVTQTVSIAAFGRNRRYETPFGLMTYYVTPVAVKQFYAGVHLTLFDSYSVYIASPLRALMDYVYLRKIENPSGNFLTHSLRIEPENIACIHAAEAKKLLSVYHSKYVQQLLKNLIEK